MGLFNKKKQKVVYVPQKKLITVQTDYGSIKIINLKSVWLNRYLGTYRLMYSDDIYEYNCIYWTNRDSSDYYLSLKRKLLDAYNRGDRIVEL